MKSFYRSALCLLVALLSLFSSKAATVTIDCADDMARSALVLVFNVTQRHSIKEDVFEVEDGDVIRFSFNTFDYNVNVDGVALEPDTKEKYTNWTSEPINSDCTIKISASIREYGTTYVEIAALDPDGIILHEGHPEGPVVDMSSVEITESDNMYLLRVPVNLKVPKVFVYPAPGYWIDKSYIGEGKDLIETIMSTNDGNILYVLDYKLDVNDKLVYRVMCGTTGSFKGSVDNAILSDKEGKRFNAVEGYNVYDVDINYISPLKLRSMNVNIEENSAFSVYLNGMAMTPDKDFGYFIMDVNANSVIYAFIGRAPAVRRTITVEKPQNDNQTSIVYDKIMEVGSGETSFKVFNTAEITVTPAPGCDVYIDDEMLTLTDGSVTFSAEKNCTIKIVENSIGGLLSLGNETPEGAFAVVSIDGKVIYKAATKQQVDALQAGFYIINGKKVMK